MRSGAPPAHDVSDVMENQNMATLAALSQQYDPRKKAKWIATICFRKEPKHGSSALSMN
jgi:hypothetical protein